MVHTTVKHKPTGKKAVILQAQPSATALQHVINRYGWLLVDIQIKYPKLKHLTHAKAKAQ